MRNRSIEEKVADIIEEFLNLVDSEEEVYFTPATIEMIFAKHKADWEDSKCEAESKCKCDCSCGSEEECKCSCDSKEECDCSCGSKEECSCSCDSEEECSCSCDSEEKCDCSYEDEIEESDNAAEIDALLSDIEELEENVNQLKDYITRKLRRYASVINDWRNPLNWGDDTTYKWFISLTPDGPKVSHARTYQGIGTVYFTSEDGASDALEWLRVELEKLKEKMAELTSLKLALKGMLLKSDEEE